MTAPLNSALDALADLPPAKDGAEAMLRVAMGVDALCADLIARHEQHKAAIAASGERIAAAMERLTNG